jgi:hypothetical protein
VRNSLILNCSCLSGKASGKAPRECESLSLPLLGCVSTYYMTVRRGHVIAPRRGRPTDLRRAREAMPPTPTPMDLARVQHPLSNGTGRGRGRFDSTRLGSLAKMTRETGVRRRFGRFGEGIEKEGVGRHVALYEYDYCRHLARTLHRCLVSDITSAVAEQR